MISPSLSVNSCRCLTCSYPFHCLFDPPQPRCFSHLGDVLHKYLQSHSVTPVTASAEPCATLNTRSSTSYLSLTITPLPVHLSVFPTCCHAIVSLCGYAKTKIVWMGPSSSVTDLQCLRGEGLVWKGISQHCSYTKSI